MTCSRDDYLRCVLSLLKEEAYSWWETIDAVVPAKKIFWEFFQNEFKNKYVGKRYLDKKKREFLDLRQEINQWLNTKENLSTSANMPETLYLLKKKCVLDLKKS